MDFLSWKLRAACTDLAMLSMGGVGVSNILLFVMYLCILT